MGIRPNGSGAIPPATPDNPETRYSDWLTDLEDSGEIVGGVWQETDAKASSGNDGVTDLAGRLATAEALLKNAIIAVPPASLAALPAGQVYLDVPTLTIHTK